MGTLTRKRRAMVARRGAKSRAVWLVGLASLAITLTACPTGPLPPTITSFTADPTPVTSGQSSTLSWAVAGAAPITLTIDHGIGDVTGKTSTTVDPTTTTTYTLTATNTTDTATAQATVTVNAAPTPPTITSFTTNPTHITQGQSSTLSWSVTGTAPITLTIDHGIGDVTGETSTTVTPSNPITYTLTATNTAGTDNAQATIAVFPTPYPPLITSFTSTTITGGATFAWDITNPGGGNLTCTLDATGNGTIDVTVPDCESVSTHDHLFTTPGRYTSELTVTDSHSQTDTATVSTIAAGTSATPYTWAVQLGTSGDDFGTGITSDANGNVTFVGTTTGALPGHVNAGRYDIVLAKYAPGSNQVWARQIGTTGSDEGHGITSDPNGNTILVGFTDGALPGHTNAGFSDIVLAKYDPNGNQLWARQVGTSGIDHGYGITSDPNGNTILVGFTDGALPGHTNAGGYDILLAKYDPNGNQLWARQVGTSGNDEAYGVASDAIGNTTLVGTTVGALPGHTNAGGADIVLAKYDPNGNQLWATQLGTDLGDYGLGITSDPNGNTTLAGSTVGALPGHTNAGGRDILIAKYDPNGNQLWATQEGGSSNEFCRGITSDSNGNTTLVSSSADDILLAQHDPSGNRAWTRQLSIGCTSYGYGITSDADSSTTLVGHTYCALPGHTNAGGRDIVIVKYLP